MVLFVWKHPQLAAIRVSHRLKQADETNIKHSDFIDFISSVDGLFMDNDKVIFKGNLTTGFNKGDFASVRQFLKGKRYAHWSRLQGRDADNQEHGPKGENVATTDFAVRFISSLGMALQSPVVTAQAHQMAFSTYIHSAMVQVVGQNLASLAKLVKTVKATAPPEWCRFLQEQVTRACHARHKFSLLGGGCLCPSTAPFPSESKVVVISLAACLPELSQGGGTSTDDVYIRDGDDGAHKRLQVISRLFDVQHQQIKGVQEETELLRNQLMEDKVIHQREMKELKEMSLGFLKNNYELLKKTLPEAICQSMRAQLDGLLTRAVQAACSGSAEQTVVDMILNPPSGINLDPIVSKTVSGLSRSPTEDDLVAEWINEDTGKKKGWKFDLADRNRRQGDNLETGISVVSARSSSSGSALRSPTAARTAGATHNNPASSCQVAAASSPEVA